MGARGQGQFVELLVAAVADGGGEKGEDMRRAAGAGGRTGWGRAGGQGKGVAERRQRRSAGKGGKGGT